MKVLRIYTKMEDGKYTMTEFEVFPGDYVELRDKATARTKAHPGTLMLTIHP